MNKQQLQRARDLLDRIEPVIATPMAPVFSADKRAAALEDIRELRGMLKAPPTLHEIFKLVPGDNVTAKAEALQITRPTYYDLAAGRRRPTDDTLKRMAKVTGIPVEILRNAMP